jgi:hypothetical protein
LDLTKKTELERHEINIGLWEWNHIKSNHLKNQGDKRITLITEEQVPLLKITFRTSIQANSSGDMNKQCEEFPIHTCFITSFHNKME